MLIHSGSFTAQPFIPIHGLDGDWKEVSIKGAVLCDTANAHLYLQVSTDRGATWINGYTLFIQQTTASPTVLNVGQWTVAALSGGTAKLGEWIDFEFRLLDLNNPLRARTHFEAIGISTHNANAFYRNANIGYIPVGMINAARIIPSPGNITGWITVDAEQKSDTWPVDDPVYRVAAIGASLTAGSSGGWAGQLKASLQTAMPGNTVVIRDWARGSTHIRHGLFAAGNVVGCQPDVAIIDYAAADAHVPFGISLSESEDKTRELIDIFRTAGIDVYLVTGNPMTTLTTRPDLADYVQQYRDFAVSEGVGLIDTWVDWGSPSTITFQGSDGVHPTASEHLRVSVPAIVAALT